MHCPCCIIKSVTMDTAEGLGSLRRLPTEVRALVFASALGSADDPSPLPVLLVSRAWLHEAADVLYGQRGLLFQVDASHGRSSRCTCLLVSDSTGKPLGVYTLRFLGSD